MHTRVPHMIICVHVFLPTLFHLCVCVCVLFAHTHKVAVNDLISIRRAFVNDDEHPVYRLMFSSC
jgi:hypothetical protein